MYHSLNCNFQLKLKYEIIKTRRELVDAVTAAVKTLHSYTLPETIAFNVMGGSSAYMQWVRDATISDANYISKAEADPNADSGTDSSSVIPIAQENEGKRGGGSGGSDGEGRA